MSHGTYRNDLDAAQMRSAALELDLASAQSRIEELEGSSKSNDASLQRLLDAGALENKLAENRNAFGYFTSEIRGTQLHNPGA